MLETTKQSQKWALLIGINKYKYSSIKQLQGCFNDVELMSNILQENFGFLLENITLLQDEQATRESILTAMDTLVDRVDSEDIVVIHYSGHGSQMTDREGDEKDGLDETIVPYDSGRSPHPNRDITDDEIYLLLLRLGKKTSRITLIFDCCHSGTISRDPFGANERWLEPDLRPIEELPPSPIAYELAKQGTRDIGSSGWLPLSDTYVLIAACRDEEKAYEYSLREDNSLLTHGTLTYFLGKALRNAQPGNTYRDIFEQVSPQVTAVRGYQHPQMEGARDRLLFDLQDIKPMSFVSVRERKGNQVTLRAGAAHGMTVGSYWAIYSPATKQVTEEIAKLGLVEITDVQAVTANAKILEESYEDAIATGCRAVEEEHSYGQMCLKVEVQVPDGYESAASELLDLVRVSSLLKLVEVGETANAKIYLIPTRTKVNAVEIVPQLGDVSQPTWVVVGDDGQLIVPPQVADKTGAINVLRDNLEKVVRYRQILFLQNPNHQSLLKDKVEFSLQRKAADGSWVVAEVEHDSGLVVFQEGEEIAIKIINKHNAAVYISILDFGLTGKVDLLHPIEGANEKLIPGQSIEIGVREGDEIILKIPDDFPFVPVVDSLIPIGETETFKLLVTVQETDFSFREQEGFEIRGDNDTNLLKNLLDLAWMGDDGRDAVRRRLRNHCSPEEEWITVERSFFLQRHVS
jgi:Caspase domain